MPFGTHIRTYIVTGAAAQSIYSAHRASVNLRICALRVSRASYVNALRRKGTVSLGGGISK